MARLALAVTGGVIGGIFGGPIGAEIGLTIGGILGSALFPGQVPNGPRLNDLHVSSATDGAPIPFGYNLNRVAANLIYTSGIKEITTNSATSGGSGGGKGTTQQRNFTYFADFAAAFGEGPCKLGRVWFDSKIVYDPNLVSVPVVLSIAIGGQVTVVTQSPLNVTAGTQIILTGTSLHNATGTTTNLDQVTSVIQVLGPNSLLLKDQTNSGGAGTLAELTGGTIGPVAANGQQITKLSMVGDLVTAKCNLNPEVGSQVLIIDIPQALHGNAYAGYFTVVQTAPTFFTYYNPSSPNLFTIGDDTGNVFVGWAVPALPQYAPPVFYAGTESQNADPVIQAANGAANTPAFRGIAYALWQQFPLANFSNRIPNIRAEITYLNNIAATPGWGPNAGSIFNIGDSAGGGPGSLTTTFSTEIAVVMSHRHNTGVGSDPGVSGAGWLNLPGFNIYIQTQSGVATTVNPGFTIPSDFWTSVMGLFQFGGSILFGAITSVQVLNNVAIISCINDFVAGTTVTFGGLSGASFLNGLTLTIQSASLTQFTVNHTGANYGPTADSGTATWFPVIQQTQVGSGAFSNTATVTFPNNVQKGTMILAGYNSSNGIQLNSVQDTAGTGYTIIQAVNSGESCTALAYGITNVAGPNTVTFNLSGLATGAGVTAYEVPAGGRSAQFLTYTLPDIVTDVCSRSGLTVTGAGDEHDVSLLPLTAPTGYVISRPSTGQDILRPLAQAYFFDGVESGGVLRFVPRGGTVATLTIPEADLGLEKDNYKIEESLSQAQDLPREIQVLFNDPALGYQQNKQHKRRHTRIIKTKQQFIYEFPFTIDASTARQISEKILFMDWIERKPYKFNTWKAVYDLLDPTDIVQFTYEGLLFQARIVKEQIGIDYKMEFTTVNENTSVYTSTVVGNSGIQPPPPVVKTVPNTILFLMDIPLLRDQDSNPTGSGYYMAMSSTNVTDWTGASLEESSDNNSFTQQDTSSTSSPYGTTLGALPAPRSPWDWDFVNSITIRMIQGSLTGDTMLNVLNGSNALAIGTPATGWEIVQFANVVQNADGSFTISTLLRGRRGTEVFCGSHTQSDNVIPLSGVGAQGVKREIASLADIQVLRYFRPTTFGQSVTAVTSQLFTNTAEDLKPYAVTSVAGTRDLSGNLTVTWIRRTRIGGDWLQGIGTVPLSETVESYDVDVMGGPTSQTVIRTFSALSSPSLSYTAAQQIADFGVALPRITLNIYQNSSVIGRGFQKNVVV